MDLAAADGGAPLAGVTHGLGVLMDKQGEPDAARRLRAQPGDLARAWRPGPAGAGTEQPRHRPSSPRRPGGGASTAGRKHRHRPRVGNPVRLAAGLTNLGQLESAAGNLDRAIEALQEALAIDHEAGDPLGIALDQQSLALVSLRAGRPREARDLLTGTFDYVAGSGNTSFLVNIVELSAAIAAALGDPLRAARLAGAAESIRQQFGMPTTGQEAARMEQYLAPSRAAVTSEAWDAELAFGQALSQPETIALLLSPGQI